MLEQLKILDFSQQLPGPFATMRLADMGADVIRISTKSRPDLVQESKIKFPDMQEGLSILGCALARNKKTISLNLKTPEAIQIVKELIKEYDIILEQFRPGVMEKLGLGYEELSKLNEKLIYVSFSGYGQDGANRLRVGHDINYLAQSGIAGYSGRKGELPPPVGVQIGDFAGSMNVMVAILAAVLERNSTGKGQYIDVSIFDSVFQYTLGAGTVMLGNGSEPSPESERTSGRGAYDYYECADGKYLCYGGQELKFYMNFCNGIGLPEFGPAGMNPDNAPEIKPIIRARMKEKTSDEWMKVFEGQDVCLEPVLTLSEAYEGPQIKDRGLIVDVPRYDGKGTVRQLAEPIKFGSGGVRYKSTGLPTGFSRDEIMHALGYSDEKISELADSGVFD